MIGVIMRGEEDIQRYAQGYRPCQDAGKDGREPATRQRIPRIAGSYQELDQEAGKDSSLEFSEEAWPCLIQASTLQNCERNICIVLSNLFSDMP